MFFYASGPPVVKLDAILFGVSCRDNLFAENRSAGLSFSVRSAGPKQASEEGEGGVIVIRVLLVGVYPSWIDLTYLSWPTVVSVGWSSSFSSRIIMIICFSSPGAGLLMGDLGRYEARRKHVFQHSKDLCLPVRGF